MTQKEIHIEKLHIFFNGNVLKEKHDNIMAGQPVILLTPNDEPWSLKTDEIEAILHQYQPELSATVFGKRIVIFYESEDAEEE